MEPPMNGGNGERCIPPTIKRLGGCHGLHDVLWYGTHGHIDTGSQAQLRGVEPGACVVSVTIC